MAYICKNILVMIYLTDRITVDPVLCGGKPTIREMGITVETVMGYIMAGDTKEEILKGYPWLEMEDIDACIAFTMNLMQHKIYAKPITNGKQSHAQLPA